MLEIHPLGIKNKYRESATGLEKPEMRRNVRLEKKEGEKIILAGNKSSCRQPVLELSSEAGFLGEIYE